jgi:ATP citrate (pro-S)-lyase
MSQKAIREFDGKNLLSKWLQMNDQEKAQSLQVVQVNPASELRTLPDQFPWLLDTKLVVKPDQLIKRRGKSNLIKLNATWAEACAWIEERRGVPITVSNVTGVLDHFLVEPFVPHEQSDEYYICIQASRDGDEILFYHEGGVNVGDVDAKAKRLQVPIGVNPSDELIKSELISAVPIERQDFLASYIVTLFDFYATYHFAYLEINPLVMTSDPFRIYALDMAAKIDEAAKFECSKYWGDLEFPHAFGHVSFPEEEYIASLDEKTGASLKLTILNHKGRVWTLVAGGGASVIYADTICDYGYAHELANYGEYSGAPTEALTYSYTKTVLDLMTREAHPDGKFLFIGGGIANFTNVAETFKGIITALKEFAPVLREHNIHIYVRRGGPNYQEGLKRMKAVREELGIDMEVFGPETHITSIVAMAFNKPVFSLDFDDRKLLAGVDPKLRAQRAREISELNKANEDQQMFTNKTTAIVYGMQPGAVQNMLDFDYICQRKTQSVVAMVYTFSDNHFRKFYWGSKEIMIPVYQSLSQALKKFPDVSVMVNFASFRSVYDSTTEMLRHPQIKTIAVIAEGVPERRTRMLLAEAKAKGVNLIGPATVGGLKPGCFRIGNTGGKLDNIIDSKLFRPGSVAYVSRSGGLSNELNNVISRVTDGVYEGVAIGGDRYPGSTFIDHLLRFQDAPQVKMLVLLGEVGGSLEYEVVEALQSGRITKPLIAWCTGTCASAFSYDVQFGHAGAMAQGKAETAAAKNAALRAAGAIVPENFEDFAKAINAQYISLVEDGTIIPLPEVEPPKIPIDYAWARKLGMIRRPASFVSSISDERGDELTYAGMKISNVFSENIGVGGVLSLLWFRRRLPDYAGRFIEMVLMVTADHGPAVSGAHNTIVAARAGKDMISSLCSGLLTIGPRFGGALDGAAEKFSWGFDNGLSAEEFVDEMRKRKELIMGIGHKVKSLENPDARVVIIKEYAQQNFPRNDLLQYALAVEQVTTKKKSNLILNVDGCIAVCFIDMLRGCGCFTREEVDDYVRMGALNGLFVLGRSMGFMGHYLDQNRLKQGLYRHDTDDISYLDNLGDF